MEANPTSGTTPSAESKKPIRRTAAPAARTREKKQSPLGGLAVGLIILALLAGAGIGVLGMHLRNQRKEKEVVVAVNGSSITKDRFYARLEQAAGIPVLNQMIGEKLREEYAHKKGVAPTEADVEKRFTELSTKPDFDKNLQSSGMSRESFKQQLRDSMMRTAVVSQGIEVKEEELSSFYQKNIKTDNPTALFYQPATIQIAVIITSDQANAAKALQELRDGVAWPTVVKKYSKDRSSEHDGLLPPIKQGRTRSSKVPGLEPTLFGMKVNEQIGPRQFAGAWWIIRCLDKQPAKTKTFDEVKDDCRQGVLVTRGVSVNQSRIEAEFKEFQKQANIQAFWTQYRDALPALKGK